LLKSCLVKISLVVFLNIDKIHFSATYNFEGQDLSPKNWIVELIREILFAPFGLLAFPGAFSLTKHFFIDYTRVAKAERQLSAIGGVKVQLTTPDRDRLSGYYLKTEKFKETMFQYFELVEEQTAEGTHQKLLPKKEASEMQEAYKMLVGVGVEFSGTKESPYIDLGFFSPEERERSAVIIGHGSAITAAGYKHLALLYLMNGIDVLMLDLRGYGQSSGNPTDVKMNLDFETAYQFLRTHAQVRTENIWVHAHCLSGGPGTDLCSRRQGVNLILDRSFACYQDLMIKKSGKYAPLIERLGPWIVEYNNHEKMEEVKGHICLISSLADERIPYEQTLKLIDHLPETKKMRRMILSLDPHDGSWARIRAHHVAQEFIQFLRDLKITNKMR
jgi:uncharacterized protein